LALNITIAPYIQATLNILTSISYNRQTTIPIRIAIARTESAYRAIDLGDVSLRVAIGTEDSNSSNYLLPLAYYENSTDWTGFKIIELTDRQVILEGRIEPDVFTILSNDRDWEIYVNAKAFIQSGDRVETVASESSFMLKKSKDSISNSLWLTL
jgi:hypothetical protein